MPFLSFVVLVFIIFIYYFLRINQTLFTLSNNWSPFWKLQQLNLNLLMHSFLFGFRLTLHLDAFHFPINNTIHNRLGDEETQLPSLSKEIPVSCLPNLSPICLIGFDEMTNHVIYTSSEFEKMQFLKIQVRSITLTYLQIS